MADATVRVTGTVLNVDERRGTTRPRDGEPGRPYLIRTARVLVAETGVADVTLSDDMTVIRGEDVDFIADASVYRNAVQLRAVRAA